MTDPRPAHLVPPPLDGLTDEQLLDRADTIIRELDELQGDSDLEDSDNDTDDDREPEEGI